MRFNIKTELETRSGFLADAPLFVFESDNDTMYSSVYRCSLGEIVEEEFYGDEGNKPFAIGTKITIERVA